MITLQEDLHVHSTFSDGKNTLEENVARARELGLRRLGCVDHVRRDTTWVQDFVEAVDALRDPDGPELLIGVEAKLLDAFGRLDTPDDLAGVDRIYVADHRVPWGGGCLHPKEARAMLEAGELHALDVIESLVSSTVLALASYPPVVLAHLFSILPKLGLAEGAVTHEQLIRLSYAARLHNAWLEVDERWRCPGPRAVSYFLQAGVPVVASTDSHMAKRIARFEYVEELARDLGALAQAC